MQRSPFMEFEMICVAAFLGGIATSEWTQSEDLRAFLSRMVPWTFDVGVAALAIALVSSPERSPWLTGLLVAVSVGLTVEAFERLKPRRGVAPAGMTIANEDTEPGVRPHTALAGVPHS